MQEALGDGDNDGDRDSTFDTGAGVDRAFNCPLVNTIAAKEDRSEIIILLYSISQYLNIDSVA
jgi:hypothetical protein